MKKVIIACICLIYLTACIPYNKYQRLDLNHKHCMIMNDSLSAILQSVRLNYDKLKDTNNVQTKIIENLKIDTSISQMTLRRTTNNYDQINKTYDLLVSEKKRLLEGNENEKRELQKKLNETIKELNDKIKDMQNLTHEIEAKKTDLNNITFNLNNTQEELFKAKSELEQKNKSLVNLQNVLRKQDSIVHSLKIIVTEALLGFENKGLTIQIKNGKVYVSLEENLLFASGSIIVDKKGAEALKNLAKLLDQNPDINIMVEGHTDNVPYKGDQEIRDNWDLSALRATSVVRILLKSSNIDPKRITVAGRGEYFPVDPANTTEARQKNRRTEIILTPKLDELFNIIETN